MAIGDWPTCIPISAITSFFSFLYSYRLTFDLDLDWILSCPLVFGLVGACACAWTNQKSDWMGWDGMEK